MMPSAKKRVKIQFVSGIKISQTTKAVCDIEPSVTRVLQ